MAFVRWRGNCAQLLTTIYRDGRSQQRLLANLQGGYAVPLTRRAEITTAFPTVPIDWAAVDRALATGPPGESPVSPRARTWAEVAHDLRDWALQAEALLRPSIESPITTTTLRQNGQPDFGKTANRSSPFWPRGCRHTRRSRIGFIRSVIDERHTVATMDDEGAIRCGN